MKQTLIGWMVMLLLFPSCASKKFVYWKDLEPGTDYPVERVHEAVIQRDDRLDITVGSKNPELAIPFNMQGGAFRVENDGSVSASAAGAVSTREKGYRVDVDGNIDFPILGKLHVEGLTLNGVQELIKNKIVEGDYIKSPLVTVELLNFKYTVLGAVGHTGTFTVNGDRITLVDAIANAGDLATNAKVDEVQVIREVNGKRKVFVHDFREKALFDSPAFYLQQNDIVYVEPKYRKKSGEERGLQYGTWITSLVTAVCSLFWVIK